MQKIPAGKAKMVPGGILGNHHAGAAAAAGGCAPNPGTAAGNEILSKEEAKLKQMQVNAFILVLCLLGAGGAANAQERNVGSGAAADIASESAGRGDGVPIERVIAAVARKTGKKYLIDSRVHGPVQIVGQDISSVSYPELLSILLLVGATAVEGGNYVSVVPESIIRQMPLPMVSGKENYPEAQWVTTVIAVKNVPAASLVPILRPLLPTAAHLAAAVCTNSLLVTDTFVKVKLLEKLIASLDVGSPYAARACEADTAHAAGNGTHP
jgi:type II secretory pathway component GspD/PulD (secretin)